MLLGLLLRHGLKKRLKLVFTSASQRRHTHYTRLLISGMDAVVAASPKSASYLRRPARVVPHGIDTETFRPTGARRALRRSLGLSENVTVGCYGRIRHQKGTDVFVDAMIAVLPHYPDATALVMGRATGRHRGYLQSLRHAVAKAGLTNRILFLPEVPVDEMPRWYQALDLFRGSPALGGLWPHSARSHGLRVYRSSPRPSVPSTNWWWKAGPVV